MERSPTGAVRWRTAVTELAGWDRPSASEGERRAAEAIAGWLGELGCEVRVEEERAHGGYWWPVGLPNVLAAAGAALALRASRPLAPGASAPLAARASRSAAPRAPARLPHVRLARARPARALAALAAGASAAALWDDLGHGRRWFRRALLPHRSTWNVVAWSGDATAPRTVAFLAHHDAAHSGLVFHPALGRIGPRLAPRQHARASHTFPVLYAVWLGPVAICAGAVLGRRGVMAGGLALALGAAAAMANIGSNAVVPGANDNLTAVGVLLALAEALAREPIEGVRVLLVSTGSEESFSEGMDAFGRRHFGELDPTSTEVVCLECLGSSTLNVLEGEGMLRMRDYPSEMRDALAGAAGTAGVAIGRGLRTVAATDALIALRAGYPVVTLASVDETKLPRNYHWPSDTPEGLRWQTVVDAIAVCESFLRLRARQVTG
ncbi:MAG TPA: M28 family peptidase [Solirubrobacteraceae bacterium]|jgi:hypothetical protein|nr:M28 family peptidase [Solirubrobacteraceae bacterium]